MIQHQYNRTYARTTILKYNAVPPDITDKLKASKEPVDYYKGFENKIVEYNVIPKLRYSQVLLPKNNTHVYEFL